MKKILQIIIVMMSLLLLTGCGNSKLQEIVDIFNNKGDMVAFADYGINITASTNKKNKIIITLNGKNYKNTELEYNFENNVLSGKFNTNANTSFFINLATIYLIDSICQINGYEENEMLPSITDAKIASYTLEKEGLLFQQKSGSTEVKIDISKKIPKVDFSDVYLEIDDVEYGKNDMQNGSFTTQRGNIIANVTTKDGISEITIGEVNNTTDSSYRSLLSIVDVLFDTENASKYIKSKYSSISEGDKDFKGVKIELNYNITNNELRNFDIAGLKIMHVTINHKEFKKSMK